MVYKTEKAMDCNVEILEDAKSRGCRVDKGTEDLVVGIETLVGFAGGLETPALRIGCCPPT